MTENKAEQEKAIIAYRYPSGTTRAAARNTRPHANRNTWSRPATKVATNRAGKKGFHADIQASNDSSPARLNNNHNTRMHLTAANDIMIQA